MKKTSSAILRVFLLAALLPMLPISLVSCTPEDETDNSETLIPEVSVPEGYKNYFIEDLTFESSANETKVPFQINVDWTMEVVNVDGDSTSWCSVEPASGNAGLHKVVVRVTPNNTYEFRTTNIHLLSGVSKVAEIVVTQGYEDAILLVHKTDTISFEASSIMVELNANVDFKYEIADSADWVRASTLAATRALTKHNLIFEVDKNTSHEDRETRIFFYNTKHVVADTSTYAVADTFTYVVADTFTLVQKGTFYEAIDLGLSVKWASCNIGAKSPEEYGGFYAWGETEEKLDYSWATYRYYVNDTITKYCVKSGWVDNKILLDSIDDAACVLWGDGWRMPTLSETKDLVNKCSWKWTTINNISGYTVTGANGNSIFLPAAGHFSSTEIVHYGSCGFYWSSTLHEDYDERAYYLNFRGGEYAWHYGINRHSGLPIRPVIE